MGRFPPRNIDPAGESIRLDHALFHRVNAEKLEQETGVHDHHPRQSFVVDTQVLVVRGSNPGHAFLHELVDEFLELEAFWEQFGVPLGGVELVLLHLVELRAPVMSFSLDCPEPFALLAVLLNVRATEKFFLPLRTAQPSSDNCCFRVLPLRTAQPSSEDCRFRVLPLRTAQPSSEDCHFVVYHRDCWIYAVALAGTSVAVLCSQHLDSEEFGFVGDKLE
nr:hypothetical protein Itr_chr03CG02020 [Ipomoea trifida]